MKTQPIDYEWIMWPECWNWTGPKTPNGYGICTPRNGVKHIMTHRIAWHAFRGEIPQGHHVDHVCGNTQCCNPFHLMAVEKEVHQNVTSQRYFAGFSFAAFMNAMEFCRPKEKKPIVQITPKVEIVKQLPPLPKMTLPPVTGYTGNVPRVLRPGEYRKRYHDEFGRVTRTKIVFKRSLLP